MGVKITGNCDPIEAENYIKYLEKKHNKKLESLHIEIDGEYADLKYKFINIPFDRIRRITGYLTGNMTTWNDSKKAEERDRVKHSFDTNIDKL